MSDAYEHIQTFFDLAYELLLPSTDLQACSLH